MVNRRGRIAVGAFAFAALIAFAAPSSAVESVQKQCGEEWAAAKKAGTVPAGQAWPGFLSECKKRRAAGGPAATPAAAATPTPTAAEKKAEKKEAAAEKKAEKAAEKKAEKTDKAAPAAAPKSADVAETCKSEYTAGKASGAVPKGTNYFKYLSECKKRHAGDAAPPTTTATPAAPPPPPAAAPAPTKSTATTPAPTTTKTPSAGRQAFIERERTCGARWKTIKGTAALPAGITTWPKYLSYCNTRLKAGQPI